jgi:hypothetical protein
VCSFGSICDLAGSGTATWRGSTVISLQLMSWCCSAGAEPVGSAHAPQHEALTPARLLCKWAPCNLPLYRSISRTVHQRHKIVRCWSQAFACLWDWSAIHYPTKCDDTAWRHVIGDLCFAEAISMSKLHTLVERCPTPPTHHACRTQAQNPDSATLAPCPHALPFQHTVCYTVHWSATQSRKLHLIHVITSLSSSYLHS